MWHTINLASKFLLTFQKRFTDLQKCILLGICTVVIGSLAGWWLPLLVFYGSLPLAVFVARYTLTRETNLPMISPVINAGKLLAAKSNKFCRLFSNDQRVEDDQLLQDKAVNKVVGEAIIPEVVISQCLKYIYRDFVQSWYHYISDEEAFLEEAEEIIEEISLLLVDRVKLVDIHSVIPDYVVLIRKHILDYQEAVKHLHTQPNYRRKKDRTKEFKKVKNVVDSFNRLGKYHIAVKNDCELELVYLRVIMETILKIFMPANLYRCTATKELVLEVLTCQVLLKVIHMFSDPDFLHRAMVLVLTDDALMEPDSDTRDTDNSNKLPNTANNFIKPGTSNLTDIVHNNVSSESGLDSPHGVVDNQSNNPEQHRASNETPIIITITTQADNQKDDSSRNLGNNVKSPACSSSLKLEQSSPLADSGETQLKTPVYVSPLIDTAIGPAQRMYVSDALSKHFRVSSSSLEDLHVVRDDTNLLPTKVVAQGYTSEPCSSSSPSGEIDLQNSVTSHFDRSPSSDRAELSFVPSFFIPGSDDDVSLHSNSSEMTVDGSSFRSESSRDSRSMSPVKPNIVVQCHSDAPSQQTLPKPTSGRHMLDVTDNSAHAVNGGLNIVRMHLPVQQGIQRYGRLVRNNSEDILISSRTTLLQSEVSGHALRKVASSSTLFDQRSSPTAVSNTVVSPAQLKLAESLPTTRGQHECLVDDAHGQGLCHKQNLQNQYHQIQDQCQNYQCQDQQCQDQSEDCSQYQGQVMDDTTHSCQMAAAVLPRPYSQNMLTESCTEGPIEASSQDMPLYLFQDIQIYNTEKIKDPSGSMYTIYLIKYRAWHLEEDVWYLRGSRANRRYREFVTLQERLEEHPIYKKKIKDVNGPHRWKVLPFGQIEIHGIEARRKFLERYLQTLVMRDQVGNSLAIREFLAYEGDAHIAFVKKAHEVPRIDKMIAKTFSGVFNKLTTRLPSQYYPEGEVLGHHRGSVRGKHGEARPRGEHKVDGAVEERDGDDLNLDYTYSHSDQVEVQTMENTLCRHIHSVQLVTPSKFYNSCDENTGSEDADGFKDAIESSFTVPPGGKVHKAPVSPFPLTSAMLDIAVELINGRNSWVVQDKVMSCLKVTVGEPLDSFLHGGISDLTTREAMAQYVRLLMDLLWPGGELDTAEPPRRTQEQKDLSRRQAREALSDFLPVILPVVVGQEDYNYALDHVMEIIDHVTLNRHLVFCLLDAIIETLLPEVCTRELQYHLLSGAAGDNAL